MGPNPYDLNRLLQNGDTFLKIGNYEEAYNVYTNIAQFYPEDYRGWWGQIVSQTKNFTYVYSIDQSQLNSLLGYVKKLVLPDVYNNLEVQYVEYMKLVAEKCALEEQNMVNNKIKLINSQTANIQNELAEIDLKIDSLKSGIDKLNDEYNNRISSVDERISSSLASISFGHVSIIIGIIGAIISVILFLTHHYGWFALTASFSAMFIGLPFSNGPEDSDQRSLAVEHNLVQKETSNKNDLEQQHINKVTKIKQEIDVLNDQAVILNNSMMQNNISVDNLNNYISQYFNDIKYHWFVCKCREFGYNINYNSKFEDYRNSLIET